MLSLTKVSDTGTFRRIWEGLENDDMALTDTKNTVALIGTNMGLMYFYGNFHDKGRIQDSCLGLYVIYFYMIISKLEELGLVK
jgi:hypothetical protein